MKELKAALTELSEGLRTPEEQVSCSLLPKGCSVKSEMCFVKWRSGDRLRKVTEQCIWAV